MSTYYLDAQNGSDGNDGLSEGNAWATFEKAMDNVNDGDLVYVQGGTDYTDEDGVNNCGAFLDDAGAQGSPITFEGYTTTPGDGGMAIIDGTANSLVNGLYVAGFTNVRYIFKNITVRDVSGVGWEFGTVGCKITLVNCHADNCGSYGFRGDDYIVCYRCSATNNSDRGFHLGDASNLFACWAHGNSAHGQSIGSGVIAKGLSYNNSNRDYHVSMASSNGVCAVLDCTGDGENATGYGLNVFLGYDGVVIVGNVFYDYATAAIRSSADGGGLILCAHNLLHSNTANYSNLVSVEGDVTSAPQFEDEGSDDYRLASGSPARAAGVDAGKTVNGTSYADIGCHQAQAAAGGGGILIHPGMTGGAGG